MRRRPRPPEHPPRRAHPRVQRRRVLPRRRGRIRPRHRRQPRRRALLCRRSHRLQRRPHHGHRRLRDHGRRHRLRDPEDARLEVERLRGPRLPRRDDPGRDHGDRALRLRLRVRGDLRQGARRAFGGPADHPARLAAESVLRGAAGPGFRRPVDAQGLRPHHGVQREPRAADPLSPVSRPARRDPDRGDGAGVHAGVREDGAPVACYRFARAAGLPRPHRGHLMKIIDTHAHFYPQEWIDLMARDGERQGGKIERTAHGYKVSAGKLNSAFSDEFVSLEARLAGMRRQRVDVQALSLTTPMVYWAPPAFGLALSQAYNDASSAACRAHPGKFVTFAMIPMQDPALALKELERAAKLPGMRGLYLATSVDGVELDDKRFWDVYARCEEIGWPIFLHPVYTIGVDRTQRYYLRNLLGNPYDTGMAAASLIFGGVLDAFPKLEINLPHAGGTLPGLIGRLDHGTKVRAELKPMKRLPSEYLRRFTYDTIGHDDRINMNLVRQVGADRIILGSDYCFDMGLDDPVATVARMTEISQSDRDLILRRTAATLLGIE